MKSHWTKTESQMLELATTMDDLVNIALIILRKMKESEGQPIVQICGPMFTGGFGNVADNMTLFSHAVEIAMEMGLSVFDQTPFQGAMIRITNWQPNTPYCASILEVFYRKVFESGLISKGLFLPDWKSSRGTKWERGCMLRLGIPAEEYPTDWLTSSLITNRM